MSDFNVLIGMMSHETNTFSSVKTSLEDFRPLYDQDIIDFYKPTRSSIGGYIDVFERENINYHPSIAATATPSGELRNKDYWHIVEYIKNSINEMENIDGILLALHGAMVAEDAPEAEGVLLREIKKLVGDKPVILTLDLHGLISDLMVENCDAIYGYDTNPHIDMYERGVEAAETMVKTLHGSIKPVVKHKKLPMIPPTINQRTTEGPMVKLLEAARKMEFQEEVLNICLFPAFPYADVKRAGSAVVVVTNNDEDLATRLANELGDEMWSLRNEFLKPITPIDEAVSTALKYAEGPVVLADVADNPGGGAPGDGTEILRELLKQKASKVGIACIKDPEAVANAIKTGVKGLISMPIGGKTDNLHGDPIKITGTVRTITDGKFIHKAMAVGVPANVGRTAVVEVEGIEIILTEESHAPNDPEIFRRNGIEPTDKKILVLKSRGHFRAAYEQFCKLILEVDAPGLTTPNLSRFYYNNIPRPIWPFDKL